MILSETLERALRWAALCHDGQQRRGSGVPYVQHVVAVAMILDRVGFAEEVVVAGLLHDVVEDTAATVGDVSARFGPEVASLVEHTSEVKRDASGQKRPWIDRKRDHLAALAEAPMAARAVVLADKLHNLLSIECDLIEGRAVWSVFHAERDQVLWYYRESIATLSRGEDAEPRLALLAQGCRETLARVEAFDAR